MAGIKSMRRRDGEELLDPDFVKAIGHPIRVEILMECSQAPICVSEFIARRKPKLGRQAIEHHFSSLLECGAIEEVDVRRERGGRAKYYGATRPFCSDEDFDRIPSALKGSLCSTYCSTLYERIQESLLAGTLNAHRERHLTWTPLELDWEGFIEVIEELNAIFHRLEGVEAEAKERMALTGSSPMNVTVAMMGFESPPPVRDHQVETRSRFS